MDLDMEKDHKFKTIRAAFRKMQEIAHQHPATEVCGFFGFDEEEELFVVRQEHNNSPSPAQFFMIDPINYLLFKDQYHLVGIFHSHIAGDEEPSEFDIKMAQNCCLPFLIYSLNTKKIHIYEPQKMECNVNIVRRMKALT